MTEALRARAGLTLAAAKAATDATLDGTLTAIAFPSSEAAEQAAAEFRALGAEVVVAPRGLFRALQIVRLGAPARELLVGECVQGEVRVGDEVIGPAGFRAMVRAVEWMRYGGGAESPALELVPRSASGPAPVPGALFAVESKAGQVSPATAV